MAAVLGAAVVLYGAFVVLSIAATMVGERFRRKHGEPLRLESTLLVPRAVRRHVRRLSRYPEDQLLGAQHYVSIEGLPAADMGDTIRNTIATVCAVIATVAAVLALADRDYLDSLPMRFAPMTIPAVAAVVAVGLFIVAILVKKGRTARRRRYHLWLLDLVLHSRVSPPDPVPRAKRRWRPATFGG